MLGWTDTPDPSPKVYVQVLGKEKMVLTIKAEDDNPGYILIRNLRNSDGDIMTWTSHYASLEGVRLYLNQISRGFDLNDFL